ncbi:hypothetical protein GCM10023084_17050 [Streptomyces lacrimifluminis]|uniref:Uncharacterized protein n=1 Tax=Streptomyces lacrimifluminis TaxID=1500077 RepID=A0A917KES6_9ACTN|nr:hypothetical protein GCM10012282_01420 [Streptomyces lacrimifluminis]
MRVIGAITIRFGTVRPFSVTGRERTWAAREVWVGAVTWGLLGKGREMSGGSGAVACMCINYGRPGLHSGPPGRSAVIPATARATSGSPGHLGSRKRPRAAPSP